ncbi:hypothetical protein Tco_1199738 [Tanacetum coccineum]
MAGFGSFIPKLKKLGSLTFTFPSIPIHLDAIISKDVYRSTKNREYTSNVIQWNAVRGTSLELRMNKLIRGHGHVIDGGSMLGIVRWSNGGGWWRNGGGGGMVADGGGMVADGGGMVADDGGMVADDGGMVAVEEWWRMEEEWWQMVEEWWRMMEEWWRMMEEWWQRRNGG